MTKRLPDKEITDYEFQIKVERAEKRQAIIEQNGNDGLHYEGNKPNDINDLNDKNKHFEDVVNKTLIDIREIMIVKGKEYRREGNVYHNFEQGAKIKSVTPESVLDGFLLKHEISINDMTNDLEKGILPTAEKVEEKFNDNLIYLLLKKAMILNRIK